MRAILIEMPMVDDKAENKQKNKKKLRVNENERNRYYTIPRKSQYFLANFNWNQLLLFRSCLFTIHKNEKKNMLARNMFEFIALGLKWKKKNMEKFFCEHFFLFYFVLFIDQLTESNLTSYNEKK